MAYNEIKLNQKKIYIPRAHFDYMDTILDHHISYTERNANDIEYVC